MLEAARTKRVYSSPYQVPMVMMSMEPVSRLSEGDTE